MISGLKPLKPDTRNYSFPRTFGATTPLLLPDAYNCDSGLTNPNQNADGYPEGCTGYTQSELCVDEDAVVYKPSYTYKQTLLIEGSAPSSACNIQDSLKSTIVYGVQGLNENTDIEAATHRRGQYFQLEETNNLDWFDSVRSTLWLNRFEKRSVSCGTPWFKEWLIPHNGIVGDFAWNGDSNSVPWHNYKICGWKTVVGVPYLIVKPWIGSQWGDNGFCYFPREVFNRVMSINGTGAFTLGKADPSNIQNVQLNILQVVVAYLYRLKALLGK